MKHGSSCGESNKLVKNIYKGLLFFTLLLFFSCNEKINTEPSNNSLSESVTENKKVTFIELGSVNCIPCKAMIPVMDEIRTNLADQVEVVFYDVWEEEQKSFAQQYNIRVIPTQVFIDSNGKEYFRHEGFFPTEELYLILEKGGVVIK